MSGCEGCFTSAKGQQEQLSIMSAKAKQQAIEEGKAKAVCQDGYEYFITDATVAIEKQYNIKNILSALP